MNARTLPPLQEWTERRVAGEMEFMIDRGAKRPSDGDVLRIMCARGWVINTDDGYQVTDNGRVWLRDYLIRERGAHLLTYQIGLYKSYGKSPAHPWIMFLSDAVWYSAHPDWHYEAEAVECPF